MHRRWVPLVASLLVLLLAPVWSCRRQHQQPEGEQVETGDESVAAGQEPITVPAEAADEPEATPPPPRGAADYRLGVSGTVQLLRLFADRFSSLPRRDRVLAYHLARAVLAGRDIVYDQLHSQGLEVRQLLEQIRLHNSDLTPEVDRQVGQALQLLWLNNGMYDLLSQAKVALPLKYEQLQRAALAASSLGAELGQGQHESVEGTLARLRGFMFEPRLDAVLAAARPSRGEDPLAGSHLNLYAGVTMADLKKFQERYPGNSRLTKVDGRLVEEIYRAGDPERKIARGRYWRELRGVIERLQQGLVVARRDGRMALTQLVEYFRTGEPQAYSQACRLLNRRRQAVEFQLGFTDRSLDPRGRKALFAGFVAVRDPAGTARLEGLQRQLPQLLAELPGGREGEAAAAWPVAAAELLVRVGREGPQARPAAYLCSSEEQPGQVGRLVVFTNQIESLARGQLSLLAPVAGLAAETPEQLFSDTVFLTVALREEAWLASTRRGRPGLRKRLGKLDPVMVALEAEASVLWWLQKAAITDSGFTGPERRQQMQRLMLAWLISEQVMLERRVLRHPRWLARRLLARYLVEEAGVELAGEKGQVQLVVSDTGKFEDKLRRLLKRLRSLRKRADRPGAALLVERYASPPRWQQASAWRSWLEEAGWRPQVALVMPKLRPAFSPRRKVVEVTVSHDENLERQMMRYRRYQSSGAIGQDLGIH